MFSTLFALTWLAFILGKKKSMSTWLTSIVEHDWWLFVKGEGSGSHKASGISCSALLLQIMMNVQLLTCV